MDDLADIIKNGLIETALVIRALNVDETDNDARDRVANQIDVLAAESDPEKLGMGLISALAINMMDQSVPMLVKMTLGRVMSDMNIKLIERIQADGAF